MKAWFSPHFPPLARHRSLHKYCLIMIIVMICRKFPSQLPEWQVKWERGWGEQRGKKRGRLPWWQSQKSKFYASGHVTNIRLNRCGARAGRAKGHLTSIAGGGSSSQIYSAGCVWSSNRPKQTKKINKCDSCNLPNGSPGGVNAAVSRAGAELRRNNSRKPWTNLLQSLRSKNKLFKDAEWNSSAKIKRALQSRRRWWWWWGGGGERGERGQSGRARVRCCTPCFVGDIFEAVRTF